MPFEQARRPSFSSESKASRSSPYSSRILPETSEDDVRPNTLNLGNEELKTRLAQVPPQKLAEALVDIRFLSDVVEATIERLLSNSSADTAQR